MKIRTNDVTEIQTLLNQGDYDAVEAKLRELERQRQVVVNVKTGVSSPGTNYTPPPIDWSFLDGTRAVGGPVSAGGTYLVGERGPEIVTMGAGGYVTPNNRLGGATYNISVNALDPQAASRAVVDAIKAYERDNGRGWRSAA